MISSLSKREWVIGLYGYTETSPQHFMFSKLYATVTRLLDGLDLRLTHVAAEGNGYTGKLVKVNSKPANRVIGSNFQDITVLSLLISPDGSSEPAYDRFFVVSMSWNAPTELLLCAVVNEAVMPFSGEAFQAVLREFLKIGGWDFGFAFCDLVERQPDFHVLSLDNGRLSKDEGEALRKWYISKMPERILKLRDVYPVNILNEKQLALRVEGGTLEEFINETPETTVEQVGKLTVWVVPWTQVDRLRERLRSAGALIA